MNYLLDKAESDLKWWTNSLQFWVDYLEVDAQSYADNPCKETAERFDETHDSLSHALKRVCEHFKKVEDFKEKAA